MKLLSAWEFKKKKKKKKERRETKTRASWRGKSCSPLTSQLTQQTISILREISGGYSVQHEQYSYRV